MSKGEQTFLDVFVSDGAESCAAGNVREGPGVISRSTQHIIAMRVQADARDSLVVWLIEVRLQWPLSPPYLEVIERLAGARIPDTNVLVC